MSSFDRTGPEKSGTDHSTPVEQRADETQLIIPGLERMSVASEAPPLLPSKQVSPTQPTEDQEEESVTTIHETMDGHNPGPPRLTEQALSKLRDSTSPEPASCLSPFVGNSPPGSQVSLGSVGPVLAAALLPRSHPSYPRDHHLHHHANARPFDLTPITRNTTEHVGFGQESLPGGAFLVSPEEGGQPFSLQGEHLSLPLDLSAPLTAPSIPPLKMERSTSVGTLPLVPTSTLLEASSALNSSSLNATETPLYPLDPVDESLLPHPVALPSRKIYSFCSRQQYEEALDQHLANHHRLQQPCLKLYQPSRQEDLVGDVGGLEDEELDQIFIARRRGTLESSSGESHKNHRLLMNPVPLEERQYSIPSIRLAHHLHGSTTSYTSNTEEDDESLLYGRDDDASLSSLGSSLLLPDEADLGEATLRGPTGASRASAQQVVVEVMDRLLDPSSDADHDADVSDAAIQGGNQEQAARRKRKQRKSEQVYQWLQSVEADENVVAEAASSKFLTSSAQAYLPTTAMMAAGPTLPPPPSHPAPVVYASTADPPSPETMALRHLADLRRQSLPVMRATTRHAELDRLQRTLATLSNEET